MIASEQKDGAGRLPSNRELKSATGQISLLGRLAVVTGASSGVGRAIALALAERGARLCAVGRDSMRLAETVASAKTYSSAEAFEIDLTDEEDFGPLVQSLERQSGLDILVHVAGVAHLDPMERACIKNLDVQYRTNVRGPYALTQHLLPLLTAARGQIVFVNSSAGLSAKRPDVGQYAATKHALKAIADSLREEVNPKGIRVLSLYLGRTATPMQEALCRQEGKPYQPASLIQPEDVASVVVQALLLPPTAEVTDISMRPMQKPS